MRIDRVKFATELARADIKLGVLAEKSGVSRVTLTAVKSGKSCSADTANKIADALGVERNALLEETGKQAKSARKK